MIIYCVKSILCLGVLWGFYQLLLEKERIHYFNRGYLLFSAIIALTLPLITLTYEKEVFLQTAITETIAQLESPHTETNPVLTDLSEAPKKTSVTGTNILPYLLWSIYFIGMILFGYRFIRNLSKVLQQILKNKRLSESAYSLVLLEQSTIPYTFLHYIFVSEKEFNNDTIPNEILTHEKIHVVQKHTCDILFVEILQVAFWFNPLFILLKKSIRLNHEFLADQGVLKQEFSI